jgi:hypothetical protein
MRFSLVAACGAWLYAPVPQQNLPRYTVAMPQAPQPALQIIDQTGYPSAGTDSTWTNAFWFCGGVAMAALGAPYVAAAVGAKQAAETPVEAVERALATRPRIRCPPVSMTLSTNEAMSGFDKSMAQFKADYPWFAKYGFGLSVKSERWNGRHAMFGWAAIIATAVCKKYGVFPDAAVALKYNDWGALTQMGFGEYISNERATIMIAHIHALGVSFAAAFGPQVLGDSLTLLDDEEDEEPYGMIIPIMGNYGLTPAAEMINGRLAMLGLVVVVFSSFASGKDILDIVDAGVGGLLQQVAAAPPTPPA